MCFLFMYVDLDLDVDLGINPGTLYSKVPFHWKGDIFVPRTYV